MTGYLKMACRFAVILILFSSNVFAGSMRIQWSPVDCDQFANAEASYSVYLDGAKTVIDIADFRIKDNVFSAAEIKITSSCGDFESTPVLVKKVEPPKVTIIYEYE